MAGLLIAGFAMSSVGNLLGRVFGNLYGGIGAPVAMSYVAGGLLWTPPRRQRRS